jgi:hypothetical protein
LLKFPVELVGVDINGEHADRSMLEQAIGEAAVGSAEIQANFSCGINREIPKSSFEFEATAGHVFLQAGANFDLRVVGDGVTGFGDRDAVNDNFAGEDHGLGFFARSDASAVEQKAV